MSKVTIGPVDPVSIMHICSNLRACDRDELFATRWSEDPLDLAEDTLNVGGPKWVVRLDGRPAATYGAAPMWKGVWNLWAYGTPHFQQIGRRLSLHLQRVMMPSLAVLGAHRAEARSIATHPTAHAWLEWLGGTREATLKGYGKNGEDFYVYAWSVRPEDVRVFERRRGQ